MTRAKILHLVDDTTAGGVMRAVDYLSTHDALCADADHRVLQLPRSTWRLGAFKADVIVSHMTLNWRGLPGMISLRASNPAARLIHVEHSYTRAFTALNVAHRNRFFAMLRLNYALFDQLVAVSDTQARWMTDRSLTGRAMLTVIPPRVDLAQFARLRPVPAPPKTIGAIGRLDHQKGFDILIDGFRRCDDPEARLLIFGEGGARAQLQARAGTDRRIRFMGHAADPVCAFSQVGLIAMPSRWEAFGLVALEAQAAGRRVLAAETDGLADPSRRDWITRVAQNTPEGWDAALCEELRRGHCAGTRTSGQAIFDESSWINAWRTSLGLLQAHAPVASRAAAREVTKRA